MVLKQMKIFFVWCLLLMPTLLLAGEFNSKHTTKGFIEKIKDIKPAWMTKNILFATAAIMGTAFGVWSRLYPQHKQDHSIPVDLPNNAKLLMALRNLEEQNRLINNLQLENTRLRTIMNKNKKPSQTNKSPS
jgi:hypothetical protein